MMISVLAAAALLTWQGNPPPQTAPAPGFGAQPRTPPRDATPEKRGTGVIRGRILNAEGRPLRRGQVRVNGEAISHGRPARTKGTGGFGKKEKPARGFTIETPRGRGPGVLFGANRPG